MFRENGDQNPSIEANLKNLRYAEVKSAYQFDPGYHRKFNATNALSYEIGSPDDPDVTACSSMHIVAEGVGEIASQAASRIATRKFFDHYLNGFTNDQNPVSAMKKAILATDADIRNSGNGLSTSTLAVAVIRGEELYLVDTGGTRAGFVRDREMEWLTEEGERTTPLGGSLTPDSSTVDSMIKGPFPLKEGDRLVLCTDGLSSVNDVRDSVFWQRAISSQTVKEACDRLITEALEAGGKTNVAVQVVDIIGFKDIPEPDKPNELQPSEAMVHAQSAIRELAQIYTGDKIDGMPIDGIKTLSLHELYKWLNKLRLAAAKKDYSGLIFKKDPGITAILSNRSRRAREEQELPNRIKYALSRLRATEIAEVGEFSVAVINNYFGTDPGGREDNQDYLKSRIADRPANKYDFTPEDLAEIETLRTKGDVFVVADGVGGLAQGGVASKLGSETFMNEYLNSEFTDPVRAISAAMDAANRAVYEGITPKGGMGTTAAVAVVLGEKLYVANKGDSRVGLVRAGKLTWLTKDDSWVAAIERGERTRAEFQSASGGRELGLNHITDYLGNMPTGKPTDVGVFSLLLGDVIVACTDGVWGETNSEHLEEQLGGPILSEDVCKTIMKTINYGARYRKNDNMALNVVKIQDIKSFSAN